MSKDILKLKIRFATIEDVDLILAFIKDLAEYEKLFHEVIATPELLKVQRLDD